MIRINLLNSVPSQKSQGTEKKQKSFLLKPKTLLAAMLLLVIGGSTWFFVGYPETSKQILAPVTSILYSEVNSQDSSSTSLPSDTLATDSVPKRPIPPAPPEFKPKTVLSYAVEEVVREVHRDIKEVRKGSRSSYQTLTSSGKIDYQHYLANRFLNIIKKSTPPTIGFKHLILSTPGELYLYGTALNAEEYTKFKRALFKHKGLFTRKGIHKVLKNGHIEFSIYGTLAWNPQSKRGLRIVSRVHREAYVRRFVNHLQSQGMKVEHLQKKSHRSQGNLERTIYQVTLSQCSYQQIQSSVQNLYTSKSSIGVSKLSLKGIQTTDPQGSYLEATLDLVVYAKKGQN